VASPQSETLTGPLWTLPACNGPSPGPGLTPVGCTFASSTAAAPQPTTTYSWPEFNSLSSTSEARQGDSLHSQASPAAVTASTQSPTNSQSWTFDSTPCVGNKDFECVVVNGSSTVTLGPISQILGLGAATLTPSLRPTSGNHLQNWTANSTPCAGYKSFECVDTDSGIVTLGHKASLKYSQISTSNSTPCADNKSFECVVNGSSTITLGPIASLTAPPYFPTTINTLSTTNGLLSTILSDLGLPGLSSTTLSSVTNPRGGMTTAPSSLSGIPVLTPCTSNASLECLVQGTQTFVGGSLGLPTQTVPPNGIPCAQNTTLECVVQGSRTFTVGKLPPKTSIGSSTSSFQSQSTTTVALTLPPFTSSTSTHSPHDPYPYPRASSASVKRFKIPTILIILCSLPWIVASVDLLSTSYLVGRGPPDSASTSTDINYGPLVTSLAAFVSGTTVPVDGNYGIGAPPATTSTAPADGNWGIGVPPAIIATMSAPPPIGSSSGKSISPDAVPASTTLTHAVSGASSSFSPFPTNFIQPVTGSGTEAPEMRSSPPLLSKTAQSGSSRLRSPCFLFLLSCIFLHVAATGVPTPTLHSETRSGSILERSTKAIPPISPRQDPPPDPLRSNFLTSQTITIPATNGSPNPKPPFLLILLASLVSMRAVTMTVAPRGTLLPSLCAGQTDMSSCEAVGGVTRTSTRTPDSGILAPTPVITQPTTETTISSRSHGPSPILSGPGPCVANTSLECILEGGNTITIGTLSSHTNLQTVSDTSIVSISSTATSASSAPSKTATSGSSKTKIPSLLLVLSSFFENAWAGLFRPAPTVEQRAAEERAAQLEAMTASLPPTSASISLPNHEAAKNPCDCPFLGRHSD
jgi:hypothetical protein